MNHAVKALAVLGKVKDRPFPVYGGQVCLVLRAVHGHGAHPDVFAFPNTNGQGGGGAEAEACKGAKGGSLVLAPAPVRLGDGQGCGLNARALVGRLGRKGVLALSLKPARMHRSLASECSRSPQGDAASRDCF
jgi:hypothetical protein